MSLLTNRIKQQELKEMLKYYPETGEFIWKIGKRGHTKAGAMAGSLNKSVGYIYIGVGGRRRYAAHQLAWLFEYGVWPDKHIDHINGIRTDNRIQNLRLATQLENNQNRRTGIGRTGYLGVRTNGKRFSAMIKKNYKDIYLGTFDTPEEAHAVYIQAKREMHPSCTL